MNACAGFANMILELGVNMMGLEPLVVKERIENLVYRVISAHPEKPIFCLGAC